MSGSTPNNITSPLPAGHEFSGDEFSNNLFSDLAPLLTLFGEQVTKQFVSMSMGWTDDILLAMGPLGIMTIMVSAIRVSGVRTLKAFIGRARESRANAEKEILSSTSADVCELWNGQEVVRELGTPAGMKDLIILTEPLESKVAMPCNLDGTSMSPEPQHRRIFDISKAVAARIIIENEIVNYEALNSEAIDKLSNGAPNIALNIQNSTTSPQELLVWAIVATILQASAVGFPAVTTYYLKWNKSNGATATYGYPCFATGTVAVVIGIIFCGRVIEGSTTEYDFSLKPGLEGSIMRLQRTCRVSDQTFKSYAIFNSAQDSKIRVSRVNEKPYNFLVTVGTLAAIIGFIVQFVGLRALHWSATVYQLGVMLIMTIVRSFVRRGLIAETVSFDLPDGHELAWLLLYMDKKDAGRRAKGSPQKTREDDYRDISTATELSERRSRTSEASKINTANCMQRIHTGFNDLMRRSPKTILSKKISNPHILRAITRWEPLTAHRAVVGISDTGIFNNYLDQESTEDEHVGHAFPPWPSHEAISQSQDVALTRVEMLSLFPELQRLIAPPDLAIDSASILASTIERTMDFLVSSNHVLWHKAMELPMGAQTLLFNVRTVYGDFKDSQSNRIQNLWIAIFGTKVKQKPVEQGPPVFQSSDWKINVELLNAVLCSWLFALNIRRSAVEHIYLDVHKYIAANFQGMDHFWPRPGPHNVFLRIVDTCSSSTISPSPPGDNLIAKWIKSEDTAPLVDLRGSINPWVIWGSQYANCFRKTETERGDFKKHLFWRTHPGTTVAALCALEIYSYFIDTVASKIQRLGGTTIEGYNFNGGARFSNSLLKTLATECVSTGLAPDMFEAYSVIIPAFAKYNLLPHGPHENIEWEPNSHKEPPQTSEDEESPQTSEDGESPQTSEDEESPQTSEDGESPQTSEDEESLQTSQGELWSP